MFKISSYVVLLTFILVTESVKLVRNQPTKHLRGVTIINYPYIYESHDESSNKRFEGFGIDLMNAIGRQTGLTYGLYLSPDGAYGRFREDGTLNGMLGEVQQGRADFAVADITITDARQRLVDFTDAFIETSLYILIRKEFAENITSFADLAAQSTIKYGTLNYGSTQYFFSQSEDPIVKKMHKYMSENPDLMTKSYNDGVQRVLTSETPYAYIMEGLAAKVTVQRQCDLTYIEDSTQYYPRGYALAVPKGSAYKDSFNQVIRNMKANGEMNKLIDYYWYPTRCPN